MKKMYLIFSFFIFSKIFSADRQELKISYYDYLSEDLCTIEIEKHDTIEQLINKIDNHRSEEKCWVMANNKIKSLIIYNWHTHEQIELDLNDTVEKCKLWDLEAKYHVYIKFECIILSVKSMDGKEKLIPIFRNQSITGVIEDIRQAFSVPRSKTIELTFHGKVIRESGYIDRIEGILDDLSIQFITQDSRW